MGYLPEHGQREPEQENKLEGVVEGEPVDDAKGALKDSATLVSDIEPKVEEYSIARLREESEDDPVLY